MKFCQLNTAYAVHYVYFTDVATHCYFSKELIQKFRKMFHKVAAYIQSKKKVKMNDYFKYIIIMRLHCNIDECLRIVPKYDFLAWVRSGG